MQYKSFKLKAIDLICLLPTFIFLLLTFQFWGETPSFDTMVLYRETTQFFNGGLKEILNSGVKIHPPLIYILTSLFFFIFGKNPWSYNLMGLIVFASSSITLYFLTRNIFNRKVAATFIVLLFTNPITVVNSFHLANDILVMFGIILALTFYIYDKKLLSLSLATMVLMKETALIVIFSFLHILVMESFLKKINYRQKILNFFNTVLILIPSIIIFFVWSFYLKSLGTTEWRETMFIKTNDNSYVTVLKNIFQLKMFNIFLYQNLKNTFILHFQWVFSILLLILLLMKNENLIRNDRQKKFFLTLSIVGLVYIFLVFSFPTWTLLRYGIPVYLSFFFLISLLISQIKFQKLFVPLILFFLIFNFINNLFSLDPLSLSKGTKNIYGEYFYNFEYLYTGNDPIYNIQYLKIVTKQNKLMEDAISKDADILITDCNELKIGEKFWSISVYNEFYPKMNLHKNVDCVNIYDLDKLHAKEKVTNKIVYLKKSEKAIISQLLNNNGVNVKKILTEN